MRHARWPRPTLLATATALMILPAGCKSTPIAPPVVVPAPPPPPPVVPLDTKIAWIYRLEQQRALRDERPGDPPLTVHDFATTSTAGLPLVPASAPSLLALAADPDPVVRRRAVLAVGRVGMTEGVATLVGSLRDVEADVRATAAFALGLIGDTRAIAPLVAALEDPAVAVRGRVAEGLGLIADPSAAAPVAQAFTGCRTQIGAVAPDDEQPQTPEIEACRLALFALVRLRQYDALARVALDDQGQAVSRWWPVAYALQRIGDARAVPALLALISGPGVYTPAFALRGLATARETRAVAPAIALAMRQDVDVRLRVASVRALGQIGGPEAVAPLLKLLDAPGTPQNLALETLDALGSLRDRRALDAVLNRITDPWASMRASALAAAARIDPDGFLLIMSSLERDRDWSVRAGLTSVFATLPADLARPALVDLAGDTDVRVQIPALEALAKIGAPDLIKRLFDALETPDASLRATAARLMGEAKPEGGVPRLTAAFARAESDASAVARLALLDALARYGGDDARDTAKRALGDRDWPVRVRAAAVLQGLGQPQAAPDRPALLRHPIEFFESERVLRPKFSPHAYIETRLGTIELELNVVDAPFTTHSFIELARAGFFNGVRVHRLIPNFVIQAGDPRGDGEGGPGYTIRDEFNPLPYLRGTVGMALAGKDTGSSQFFITVSPQPHLDGKYTVFGRVVNGFDQLDRLSQWDIVERIRIWDGITLQ